MKNKKSDFVVAVFDKGELYDACYHIKKGRVDRCIGCSNSFVKQIKCGVMYGKPFQIVEPTEIKKTNCITIKSLLKRKDALKEKYRELEQTIGRKDLEDIVQEMRVIKIRISEIEELLETAKIQRG